MYKSIPINAYPEGGRLKIISISLTDYAGNTKYYSYGRDYTADFIVKSINTKVTSVSLSADLPSPQKTGLSINMKAISEGSDQPEYRFFTRVQMVFKPPFRIIVVVIQLHGPQPSQILYYHFSYKGQKQILFLLSTD